MIVSLLTRPEATELGLDQEATECRDARIEFVSFPIPDRGVPGSAAEMAALADSLRTMLLEGRGVGIHCRAGIGRAALLSACVMVGLGTPVATVFDEIARARGCRAGHRRAARMAGALRAARLSLHPRRV